MELLQGWQQGVNSGGEVLSVVQRSQKIAEQWWLVGSMGQMGIRV